ncbi:MAG: hypothetical protein KAR40_15990 [Candidatus Sabulitectum sp.]|nr:hypothetical protein [Candidatus Sabulitectum sp.]
MFEKALRFLDSRLRANKGEPVRMLICGGSAMIAMNLVSRVTRDVDVLALVDLQNNLYSPAPLPHLLKEASIQVAEILGLDRDWLNNAPSSNSGGLFQMGLPEGLFGRTVSKKYGSHLTVFYVSRIDQIYFKVYASVDRGGKHTGDLLAMKPTTEELVAAANWCMTHDVSEPFRNLLKDMYNQLGFEDAVTEL